MTKYVAYYRVSTKKQGQSGLGLEAQKAGLNAFFASLDNENPIAEFVDVESGSSKSRAGFMQALEVCKEQGATLIAFRLDRLLRSLDILVQLRINKVKFTALDCLNDNDMIISIKAAFAEEELRKVSERTKKALQAKKAQGAKLGTPANLTKKARAKGEEVRRANAMNDENNLLALDKILDKRAQGWSMNKIAAHMNKLGMKTRRGGKFYASTVKMLLDRHNEAA